MKLCQFHRPGQGTRVGVVAGDEVIDVTDSREGLTSVRVLIETGGSAERIERRVGALVKRARKRISWVSLDRKPSPRTPHLLAPIDAPEVWGAGITYRRSRQYYEAHTGDGGRTKGLYDYVYESKRPELFFKATASRTVGPNGPIGVRQDSTLTAVEPELAVVLGPGGRIVGYTVGNDLSAWDIERENPLFLPQSKIFAGCFALGPVIAMPREVGDAHALDLSCRIVRDRRLLYEGRVNTREMKRRCDDLVDWLCRSNPVPAGTVLSTGTGVLVPDEHALRDGDVVEIELEKVGTLRNVVKRIGSTDRRRNGRPG
jgi:2-dehydro-3-deoxy-D-arabinonate dehydratase